MRQRNRGLLRAWPRAVAAVAAALVMAYADSAAGAAGTAPAYRIFLIDGTPLVSFGEFARAGGFVVFTAPIGTPSNPDALRVVSLPESAVDWERTDRYTSAVRHRTYAQTRGEEDYAALTGAVARALGDMAFAPDASAKLAIAADIRRQLLEWPAAHFGYRSADVRELTATVEEAISDIRAGSGSRAFDLSLVAIIEPPSEPLLPEPTLQDSLASAAAVAQRTTDRRARLSLQQSVLSVLSRQKSALPRDWYSATREVLVRSVERETKLDSEYADLTSRTLRKAKEHVSDGDPASLERLAAKAREEDGRLGYQRPNQMTALMASLAAATEKASELRQAIDQYEYRRKAFASYRKRINSSLEKFDDVVDDITSVKNLDSIGTRRLGKVSNRVSAIEVGLLPLVPPTELRSAHDLLFSSVRLMREAIKLQGGSASSVDVSRVQNASASAAGALLLLDTARRRIDEFYRRPSTP